MLKDFNIFLRFVFVDVFDDTYLLFPQQRVIAVHDVHLTLESSNVRDSECLFI